MIDDAFRGLTALDRPADPDPRFADRLYHTLAVELGYRSRPQPRGLRAPLRLAYLAAMLGLLAAAALGALLVTGQMLRQQPSELVRLSQAVYDDRSGVGGTDLSWSRVKFTAWFYHQEEWTWVWPP